MNRLDVIATNKAIKNFLGVEKEKDASRLNKVSDCFKGRRHEAIPRLTRED